MNEETVFLAAKDAWGKRREDLIPKCRHQPISFYRHFLITILHEECRFTQKQACGLFGIHQANYPLIRQNITRKVAESDRWRIAAAAFLQEFDRLTEAARSSPAGH